MLKTFFYQDATVEDMFNCARVQLEASLLFCKQLLRGNIEATLDYQYFQHPFDWVDNQAYGSVVWHGSLLLFFGRDTTNDCVHSFSYALPSHIFWHIL